MTLSAFDQPLLLLVLTLPVFWLAARAGARLREARLKRDAATGDEDLRFVIGGTLTLLALIVGFTFAMAVGRYDQRKGCEEREANAIGTEYWRAALLPDADAARARGLLRDYLDRRIEFYTARDAARLAEVDARTARLQGELWEVVASHARANPTQVAALAAAGMNDVFDTQGFTQAAWWNRIPPGAWALLLSMSIFCSLLVGYATHAQRGSLLVILPVVLAVTLFFIADIEAPRGGLIHVLPQNLQSLADSLRPR